jgi:hypothetical protein
MPFTGPIFGIRLGEAYGSAMADTDLVFDLQIESKDESETVGTTMVSRTLTGLTVKVYVTEEGRALALEITPD